MAALPVDDRWRFQKVHLLSQLVVGQDPRGHPAFDALGREFDSYNEEHRKTIVPELKLCDTTFSPCMMAWKTFQAKNEKVAQLEIKSYPGGRAQQRNELIEQAQCYQQFMNTANMLRHHLENLLNIHRWFGVRSNFAYTSIDKLHKIIGQRVKAAREKGNDLKAMLASMQDARPVDPAKEPKDRKRKLMEEVETGDLDYFPPPLSSMPTWVFVESIGGGMGSASLWARIDDSSVVRDRIVRKDTQMAPDKWENSRYWVVDAEGKKHLEYHCHAKAHKQPNGSNIVEPRKFEFDNHTMTYRIYTSYCPHGDLNTLIEANNMGLKKIPEAWVWMAFSKLVECGIAMETDCDALTGDRIPTQIVHRDLKPMNVFLDLAEEDNWPLYPQPKVGDFGLAIETCPEDDGNPLRRKGTSGTPGYYAPEQYDLGRARLPVTLNQLLAHTNVWGVGRIMLDLVNQSPIHSKKVPAYLPNGTLHGPSSFKDGVQQLYSNDLLSHIGSCLRFDPKSRPTFAELRKSIDKYMTPPEHAFRNKLERRQAYMFNARFGVQPEEEEHKLHGLPADKYPIGLALQTLKAPKAKGAASARPGASTSRWASA